MTSFTVRYCPMLDPQVITHRICFNPNYGGPATVVPGACTVRIRRKGIKPETRAAIVESVRQEGFRNPIVVYDTPQGILLGFGGGRVQAAQELDTFVPAIVVDYTGAYALFEEVTPDNWEEKFRDVPAYFRFTDVGIDTHYGLERNRDEWYDPAGIAWVQTDDAMEAVLKESPWLDDAD